MAFEASGLTIVVPAYNEAKILHDTLPTFTRARRAFERKIGLPTELIVVDNASTDDTAQVAEELGARVVRHEVRNIASVRNAGIRDASHGLVVTVDADTYLPPQAFTRIWRAMESGQYVGGAARLWMATDRAHVRVLVIVMEALVVAASGLSAGLFFFRKDAALAIGGFPERLQIAEDMAFAKTLKSWGRAHGLRWLNLRTVTILTLDRKNASLPELLGSFYAGAKAYLGSPISRKTLEYWYKPKR